MPAGVYSFVARHETIILKALYLCAIPVVIAFVFLKFQPDIGIGPTSTTQSVLTGYAPFEAELIDRKGGNHTARFLGNRVVYHGAAALETVTGIPADPRLHPLRLSALCFAAICMLAGLAPAAAGNRGTGAPVDWQRFAVAYGFIGIFSLYTYKPYDLPAFACITVFLFLVLQRRFGGAWLALIVCGLFRENGIHAVYMAAALLLVAPRRIGPAWVAVYAVTWLAEYIAVRAWFGFAERSFFLDRVLDEFSSPTLYGSVAVLVILAGFALLPVARRAVDGTPAPLDRFIVIHALSVIPWILFYRAMGGNIAEFRMLLPVALPLVFGLAYRPSGGEDAVRPS